MWPCRRLYYEWHEIEDRNYKYSVEHSYIKLILLDFFSDANNPVKLHQKIRVKLHKFPQSWKSVELSKM